jgi:GntR family transcriptional regulator
VISRESGRPAYLQIADALRERIRAGQYPPGTQLPTERALIETWGVSSKTVAAALDRLRAEGRIISVQGRGVFVRTPARRRRLASDLTDPTAPSGLRGYYAALEREGLRPATAATIEVGVPCPAEVAEFLGVDAGTPVTVRRRVMRAEGQPPDMLADSYFPDWVVQAAPAVADPATPGQIPKLIAVFGPVWLEDIISSRMPDQRERELLDLGPGVPVTVINGPTFDQEGRVLTHIVVAAPGDRFEFGYRYGTVPADT